VIVAGASDWLSPAPSKLAFINSFVTRPCVRRGRPRVRHVSVLSPSGAPRSRASGLSGEKCRYDGDYEEAMGIQAKEHQRLVVWMVRKRQAEG
jgi:hypothetical protein